MDESVESAMDLDLSDSDVSSSSSSSAEPVKKKPKLDRKVDREIVVNDANGKALISAKVTSSVDRDRVPKNVPKTDDERKRQKKEGAAKKSKKRLRSERRHLHKNTPAHFVREYPNQGLSDKETGSFSFAHFRFP